MVYINTDAITSSILNGVNTNTLAVIAIDNLTRSFPFKFEPRRLLFNEVSQLNISQMRFYITDSLGRPIGLNKIDWFMTLILRFKTSIIIQPNNIHETIRIQETLMLKRGDMLRSIFMVKVLLPMFSKRLVESCLEKR